MKNYVIQADKDVHGAIKMLCALKNTKQADLLRYMAQITLDTLNPAEQEIAKRILNGSVEDSIKNKDISNL